MDALLSLRALQPGDEAEEAVFEALEHACAAADGVRRGRTKPRATEAGDVAALTAERDALREAAAARDVLLEGLLRRLRQLDADAQGLQPADVT